MKRFLFIIVSVATAAAQQGKQSAVAERIWSAAFLNLEGSISQDGNYYLFSDSKDKSNLAIRDLRTGDTRALTRDAQAGAFPRSPRLSPDGAQVAYSWGPLSIRLTSIDGARTRLLFMADKGSAGPIAWSPDSKRLLVLLRDGPGSQSEYSFISIDNGSRARVKVFPAGSEAMPVGGSISPDGRYLAYSVRSPNPAIRGIFVMGTDGRREVPLVQGVANEESPFWTPDGRGIVFTSDRSGTLDLWSIRVADGKPQSSPQLLRANIGEIGMGMAQDGSYYYGARVQEDDLYVAEIEPKSLNVIGQPRLLSEHSRGRNTDPEWSPDGQSIAFIRRGAVVPRLGLGLGGEADVVIRSVVSGEERILTRFRWLGQPVRLTWFPDSNSVLLGEGSPIRSMQVDVQTGSRRMVGENLSFANSNVAFSRDGASLFYSLSVEGQKGLPVLRLMKRGLASGRDTELYRTGSGAYGFFGLAISPDGSQIAFLANGSRANERYLITVPTNGGSARELYRGSYADPLPASCAWTRDGTYVLVVSSDPERRLTRVKAIPFAGGDARPLAISMPNARGVTVSPDGRRVAFCGGPASSDELLVLRNLLPNGDRPH